MVDTRLDHTAFRVVLCGIMASMLTWDILRAPNDCLEVVLVALMWWVATYFEIENIVSSKLFEARAPWYIRGRK